MSKRKIGSVTFKITGEYIATTARALVVEGKWRQALEMLVRDLEGMTNEYAYSILSGDITLNGCSNTGVGMEDWEDSENKTKYLKRCEEQYANVWCCDYSLYQVSEVVRDARIASRIAYNQGESPSNGQFDLGVNADVYAKYFKFEPQTCKFTLESDPYEPGRNMLVGWKPTNLTPPPWMNESCKSYEAIANVSLAELNLRTIDGERGIKILYQEYVTQDKIERSAREETETKNARYYQIIKQNGDDFVEIKGVRIPRKPLVAWALRRSPAKHLADCTWEPISRSGEKMMNDDPNHTDWVIGAGFDPMDFYQQHEDLNQAAFTWAYNYNRELTSFELHVLASNRGSQLDGRVQHLMPDEKVTGKAPIVVIPDATTRWINVAKQVGQLGGIIICEKGGPMSHLVLKGEEYGITLMLHPKALTTYPHGIHLSIYPSGSVFMRNS